MLACRNYISSTYDPSKNLEKLSHNYKINSVGDAAGLVIFEKMCAHQITVLSTAKKNVKDSIFLVS